jgi:hypothetical protein
MVNQKQIRTWFKLSLFFLIAAAILGLLLRSAFVFDLPAFINYKHIQQTHSHIAMMGWIYGGLFTLIVYIYNLYNPFYNKLFWYTQITVFGMLFSFPFQGYGLFSIFFSTCFLLLNYVFVYHVFKDFKSKNIVSKSSRLIKLSLVFLLIASLGIFSLGVIMNSPFNKTALYYGVIQFFLHFQFNGWFVFAILGIFFKVLEDQNIKVNSSLFNKFVFFLTISCILTLALAITWSTPFPFIFFINSIGVIIQLIALFYFYKILVTVNQEFKSKVSKLVYTLFCIAIVSLSVKIIIQSAVSIQEIAIISYTIRNFVIGFIHLLMLGCITMFIFGMISYTKLWDDSKSVKGIIVFIVGILLTELLLFSQGLMIWMKMGFFSHYYLAIFLASILLPLGVIFYLFSLKEIKN